MVGGGRPIPVMSSVMSCVTAVCCALVVVPVLKATKSLGSVLIKHRDKTLFRIVMI